MKLRHVATLVLALPLVFGACRKRPPAGPGPDNGAGMIDDRAREDSIRMAEELRRRAEEQAERDRLALEASLSPVREALLDIVFFEYDSDEITSAAEDRLRMKAEILRANPTLRLRIEGHADQRGSTEYNLALGQRRAEAVRAWLGAYGIAESRLTTLSYGKERLLDDRTSEAAYARNRRAEFVITGGQLTTAPGGFR